MLLLTRETGDGHGGTAVPRAGSAPRVVCRCTERRDRPSYGRCPAPLAACGPTLAGPRARWGGGVPPRPPWHHGSQQPRRAGGRGRWRRTPCLPRLPPRALGCVQARRRIAWATLHTWAQRGDASRCGPWARGPLAERPGLARPDSRHDTFPGAGGPPKRGHTVHACGRPTTGAAPLVP